MKKALALLASWVLTASVVMAASADRWIHVKVVEDGEDGETVRINLPLSLAEKVLPTIHVDKLHNGKVRVDDCHMEDVDLHAVWEAVRNSPDNEYVTVESKHEHVRVAKSGGYMLIKVRDGHHFHGHGKKSEHEDSADAKNFTENVEVKIPLTVVNALFSAGKDELDLVAAIRALSEHGDTELVSVKDEHSDVRIWVDSRNMME